MSQQAAIRAEQEAAQERRAQLVRTWGRRARRYGVLTFGAGVLVLGLGTWAGAGLGGDGQSATIQEMTQEREEDLVQAQQELEQQWSQVVVAASDADPERLAADAEGLDELVEVVLGQDVRRGVRDLGIEVTGDTLPAFWEGRQQVLAAMEQPVVHERDVRLYAKAGARNTYVGTYHVTDAALLVDESTEPVEQNSAWAVITFSTNASGAVQQVDAFWASKPPASS